MKPFYYAHSKNIYYTQEERDQLKFLRSHFPKVLCPNNDVGELGAMQPYLDIIEKKCQGVVFSEWFDLVGRGVWEEVKHARKLKKPVYVLRKVDGEYKIFKFSRGRIVNKDDWRNYAQMYCSESVNKKTLKETYESD